MVVQILTSVVTMILSLWFVRSFFRKEWGGLEGWVEVLIQIGMAILGFAAGWELFAPFPTLAG